QIVGAGIQRAREDRRNELGLNRIHHMGDRMLAHQRGNTLRIRGVDPCRSEPRSNLGPVPLGHPIYRRLAASLVVVAHHHQVEETATSNDLGNGVADSAGPNEEDSHGSTLAVGPRPSRVPWAGLRPAPTTTA